MEWLFDPTIWAGLLGLAVLEIVFGIDNLVFIALLADRLPPPRRERARALGLALAPAMRLLLLGAALWLLARTGPLFTLGTISLSTRGLALAGGGLFLLLRAALGLHERLEGRARGERPGARLWRVAAQIAALDAVFALDAVAMAAGMAPGPVPTGAAAGPHPVPMALAVAVSIGTMLLAPRPLLRLAEAHPAVPALGLGLLAAVGLSMLAEGCGVPLPRGYLYAAVGIPLLAEALNLLVRRRFLRRESGRSIRARTAEAIQRLLGGRRQAAPERADEPEAGQPPVRPPAFDETERHMVSGVLGLADRSIRSLMTPRTDLSWIDLDDDAATMRRQITEVPHSFFPVCRGGLDEVVGIGRAKDLLADLLTAGRIDVSRLREPIVVHESTGVLRVMETLKRARGQLVLVTDEFGAVQGLVTPIDIFEAIAGEFPDEDETPDIVAEGEGRWLAAGGTDLHYLQQVLDTRGLVDAAHDYATLAGFLLSRFAHLPAIGEAVVWNGLRFEITRVTDRRIATVRIERISTDGTAQTGSSPHD
ncbi:TerC family protein [Pigmentiphaga soli]|uniref:TerC family protein n=1 Tax=Pigmentiphaga soli TaxID=1007095 RepID=A0ABP8H5X0_9BURK